jgi:chromosome segregation ATPase
MATIRERLEKWETTQVELQQQISTLTQTMSELSERVQDNPQAQNLQTELSTVRAQLETMQEDLRKANILAEHYRERVEVMESEAPKKTEETPPPPQKQEPASAVDTKPTAHATSATNDVPQDRKQVSPPPSKKRVWL